ncbi:MAG: LamG-like jellyroll fold domain-containing protein, partial [Anaerohalosphaeraceae bacterium]
MKKLSLISVMWAIFGVSGWATLPPEVYIDFSPSSPVVGQTITLDGSTSYDPDGTIVSYSWTLPGQAFCISGINTSIAKCKFNAPGTYTVSLTVEDDEGLFTSEGYQVTISAATNTLWYVRPDGRDDNDGSTDSSSGAFRTIQTAIDSASNGDEIRVYGGIYYEQLYLKNKDLQLYSYNPANTGSWELAENAIINANMQGTTVMLGGNEPNSCQIKGFTIRGGFPTGDRLALHLGFNDPNTLTLDGSGKGRDGIINGDPNPVVGYDDLSDGALEFDGNDWIQIEDYKGVAGRHPRSCAMWVKTTTAGTEMVLVSWGKDLTGQKWQLLIADSNEIALDVQNGRVAGTTSINDGNWHHVAAVFEANGAINIQDVKLYVDGVQENTTCSNYVTTPPDVNTELDGDVYVGARDGATPAYYSGVLDEVRIYSRAIKLSEIQQMAENPEPVAQWTMDAISGNTIADSSSNARTGTFSVASPTSTCSDGRMDNAISLQNNEYIRISGWNGIAGGNSWTFSGWVKTLPNPSFTQMVCTWGSSSTGQKWMLRVETTWQIAFAAWGGYVTGTTIVADGSWHHVAAVLDADSTPTVGEVQLYVDGMPETMTYTNPGQAISTTDAENILIGTRYQSGSYYNYYTGGLDDIRIYDRALNRGQIQEMTDNIGLMAHWTLDETTSPSIDSSGSDIDGTWNDSPTPSAEGYFKGALEFEGEKTVDGKKDYVSTSYCGVIGTRDRTVSAWIKAVPQTYTTEAPSLRSIISWGGTATGGAWNLAINYVLNQGPYGTIRLAAGGSKIVATTRVDDNRWHHVAAVFSNDGTPTVRDIQLYIDGKKELVSYISDSALNTGTGSNVTIGATKSTTADQYFKGKIDDVRIYDQAFTEGELRQM